MSKRERNTLYPFSDFSKGKGLSKQALFLLKIYFLNLGYFSEISQSWAPYQNNNRLSFKKRVLFP
jgi:hypothetical protein